MSIIAENWDWELTEEEREVILESIQKIGVGKFVPPKIKTPYPDILKALTGVQPMTEPAGLISYLKHRYEPKEELKEEEW